MPLQHKTQRNTGYRPPLPAMIAILGVIVLFADRVLMHAKTLQAPVAVAAPVPDNQWRQDPLPVIEATDHTVDKSDTRDHTTNDLMLTAEVDRTSDNPAPDKDPDPALKKPADSAPSGFSTISKDYVPHYSRADKAIPSCAKGRAKSFLVVFMSRSGSTAITSALSSHSQVHMELLEFLDKTPVANTNRSGIMAETRGLFERGISKGLTPGFKIRAQHILPHIEEWQKLVKEYDTRIVWQYRRNIFKSSLGTYMEYKLNDSTATSGIKKVDAEKHKDRCSMGIGCKFPVTDYSFFHALIKKRLVYEDSVTQSVHTLAGGNDCVWELPYEDFLYDSDGTMKDLQRFLGLDYENREGDRIKATKDSLCEVIENYDDFCRQFYGCIVWQPFLEDFVNNCRCKRYSHSSTQYCGTV